MHIYMQVLPYSMWLNPLPSPQHVNVCVDNMHLPLKSGGEMKDTTTENVHIYN